MPKSNPSRNRDLYRLWQEGRTIEEASLLTGIPKSTVGYYFKKYKRYAKEGRPVVIPQATEKRPRTGVDQSVLFKSMMIGQAMEMIRAGNPERAYYTLGVFKLLKDLNLEFTLEELEALQKTPQLSTGAPLEATTRKTTQTASQSNMETAARETLDRANREDPQLVRRPLAEEKTRPK